jgi:serine/threonine protein kinase
LSGSTLGNYELLVRLASGGAANVFLAREVVPGSKPRLLALKVLLPKLAQSDDFLQMFFNEARIASRLQHPNVVAISGFGQVEGVHCLAMEYVFGVSLSQLLRASARSRRPMSVGVLLYITSQLCDALEHAHGLEGDDGGSIGLVHRDVTPQNILIGFNGVPKLTDFGIAKAHDRGFETQAGIVKGKFSYMSPEQALGKPVDRRSDVFGLGIVLWESLTGQDLFRGGSPTEVLTAIRDQPIRPPSEVVPGLTSIVDPIVARALARSPRRRYQTAAEFGDAIRGLIRRAGVKLDSDAVSKELASIYGEEVLQRAIALRAALGGRIPGEELARKLGVYPLDAKCLPVPSPSQDLTSPRSRVRRKIGWEEGEEVPEDELISMVGTGDLGRRPQRLVDRVGLDDGPWSVADEDDTLGRSGIGAPVPRALAEAEALSEPDRPAPGPARAGPRSGAVAAARTIERSSPDPTLRSSSSASAFAADPQPPPEPLTATEELRTTESPPLSQDHPPLAPASSPEAALAAPALPSSTDVGTGPAPRAEPGLPVQLSRSAALAWSLVLLLIGFSLGWFAAAGG